MSDPVKETEDAVSRLSIGDTSPDPPSHARCTTCHDLGHDLSTSTTASALLASASDCFLCLVVVELLDAVTDIRKPEFTAIELERTHDLFWHEPLGIPKGVLEVRCVQEGVSMPGFIGKKYADPFPNRYQVYTPPSAGISFALPSLGLRDGKHDDYQEQANDLEDRLDKARYWYQECVNEHPDCAPRRTYEWPRRILDLGDDPIRLVPSSSIPEAEARDEGYSCLSYMWGTSGNLKTLKENYDSHCRGIEMSALPSTLADAVYVSRSLGLQYLWIDALCIIQDDLQDKIDQLPKMAAIYQGAELVISAQSASSVHEGFLTLGPSQNAPHKQLHFRETLADRTELRLVLSIREQEMEYISGVPAHHSSRPTEDNDVLVPLTTRAWVFQETFLARRIIFFTPSEMAWQCSMYSACECRRDTRDFSAMPHVERGDYFNLKTMGQVLRAKAMVEKPPPLAMLNLWGEIVRGYSGKMLSVWSDRLDAIQGAVVALTEGLGDVFRSEDYLFGLWRPFLDRSLVWHRNPLKEGNAEAARALGTLAPSWSWATSFGPIEYYGSVFDPEAHLLARVLDVRCEPNDLNQPFGSGKGRLRVLGFLIPVTRLPARFASHKSGVPFKFPEKYEVDEDGVGAVVGMEADDPSDGDVYDRVTNFAPLLGDKNLEAVQGIFLQSVASSEGAGGDENVEYEIVGTFKRVGFGYDYANRVDLYWGSEEELKSDMKAFNLV